MDSIDIAIIDELRQNARQTNQELADAVGLTPSPCLRRVKKLEESGIIAGYTAIIDNQAAGLPVTAFVRLKLSSHTKEAVDSVEERLRAVDSIQECHLISGSYDYLFRVVCQSLEGYEKFIRETLRDMTAIGSIDTSFAVGTIKDSALLPLPEEG